MKSIVLASLVTGARLWRLRASLESTWTASTAHPASASAWSGHQPSQGQCFVTSAVVAKLLSIPSSELAISRGTVRTRYGKLLLRDHCWIEYDNQIVDLTLDQIVGMPMVVCGTCQVLLATLNAAYDASPRRYAVSDAFNGKAARRCTELLIGIRKISASGNRRAA
jgi:phage baseplate assembly protein gpV